MFDFPSCFCSTKANPNAWKKLKGAGRRAWLTNTCLSIQPFPSNETFFLNPNIPNVSGLSESDVYNAHVQVKVQCFPLHLILLALNVTTVDFFSLDIEGNELGVLETIPFDLITFKVFTIEYQFIRGGGKAVLREFMERAGFIFYRTVVKMMAENNACAIDAIFIHRTVAAGLTGEELKMMGHEDVEPFVPKQRLKT